MQEDYPCAMRLMGVENFNAWAMRYLDAHPSDSPYLADLDRDFCGFMKSEYAGVDRDLILEAVRYDKAFDKAFDSANGAPVKLEGLDASSLVLAPHATPLRLRWDLGSFRREDPESVARPVPREHAVLIYRHQNTLYEKEISGAAYLLAQGTGAAQNAGNSLRIAGIFSRSRNAERSGTKPDGVVSRLGGIRLDLRGAATTGIAGPPASWPCTGPAPWKTFRRTPVQAARPARGKTR